MKKLIQTITHPLRVTIVEPTGTDRRVYKHRAFNVADALEWAACYPAGTTATIRSRFGRVIAVRQA